MMKQCKHGQVAKWCSTCHPELADTEKEPETADEIKARKKILLNMIELTKSGYAGILSNGNIVDRRKFPNAMPVKENSMFNAPKPKDT